MKKQFFLFMAIIVFFVSCDDMFLNEEYKGGDWFYLENDGAIMPVWVRGNLSSKTFILFLHTGPGNTSMTYAISYAHKKLQNDYAMVYYDQRGSGMAQGNPKPETLTIEQFTEDLDKIISLIKHKYDCKSFFLLGRSWGGCISAAYLLDNKYQNKISGWIEENGAHNIKMGLQLASEWVKEKAKQKINSGDNTIHWQKEIDWYNTQPVFDSDNFLRHQNNVNDLNGFYYDSKNDPGNFFGFTSPVPVFYSLTTLYLNNNNRFDIKNIDFSPQMYKIKIPTMILWGRHDGSLPVDLAQNAYDSIGTTQADKYKYIFEDSAHCPSLEEPDLWLKNMREFVEKYK
jgi:pimeloyl-ACP methyl ester carboxylesterase